MLQLRENEKILLVIRKHWLVMVPYFVIFTIALALIPVILSLLSPLIQNLDMELVENATNFFLSLYLMTLILFLYLNWMDYYLDMWIITDQRIIDIEQKGLFYRDIAEIPMRNVQDITIEIRGPIQTFFKFGTIKIQTAGEREFYIQYLPRLYQVKELILKSANAAYKNPK